MTEVREIMSCDVLSVKTTTPVLEVVRLMSSADVRHIPVVNGEQALVGFVSDRDVQLFGGSGELSASAATQWFSSPVSEVMTLDPLTVEPETSLDEASSIIIDAKIGALPVVEGGKVVGILSVIDLLSWSRDQMRKA